MLLLHFDIDAEEKAFAGHEGLVEPEGDFFDVFAVVGPVEVP